MLKPTANEVKGDVDALMDIAEVHKRWPRDALNIRMSSVLPVLRWVPSVTTLIGMTTALLLSVVSEAAVDTRSNRSEHDQDAQNNANASNVPDETSARSEPQSWRKSELIVILDDSLDQLPVGSDVLIEAVFQTWRDTGASLPNVSFERGHGAKPSLKPDGKSTVMLAPIDFEGHETDLAITIGFSSPVSGEISEADIVINRKHLFKVISELEVQESASGLLATAGPMEQESCTGSLISAACDDSYDLENVLTHEVGHFFGLGENYDDTRATMFSCTSACEIHKRDLSNVDVAEITALYDVALDQPQAGCTGAQIGGHPKYMRRHSLGMWSLLGLALVLNFRRKNQHRKGRQA